MLLELKNVEYSYKSKRKENTRVLTGVNYQFEMGKLYAILGSSGSGKTTLLSLLAGLDNPTSGEIFVDSVQLTKNILAGYRKSRVSLIFQNYNLIDYLTSEENVKLGGSEDPCRLLDNVGISKDEQKRNVLKLSGGQQQRVAIARALASNSEILLADEPTGNLDEKTANEIIDILKNTAHAKGKCVIVVTHSKALAEHADDMIMLSNGVLNKIEKIPYQPLSDS